MGLWVKRVNEEFFEISGMFNRKNSFFFFFFLKVCSLEKKKNCVFEYAHYERGLTRKQKYAPLETPRISL